MTVVDMTMMRHPVEAKDSWNGYLLRRRELDSDGDGDGDTTASSNVNLRRRLSKAHKSDKDEVVSSSHDGNGVHDSHDDDNDNDDFDFVELEQLKFEEDARTQLARRKAADKKARKADKKRRKRFEELYRNPGVAERTAHGLMIDAGSTGSRMHVYEFEPRALADGREVEAAVSGRKLSIPGTESRWTERLRPGLGDFADVEDDRELEETLAKYLEPLISFAKSVLHEKESEFSTFPIFLKATAGMRTLRPDRRRRIISVVRDLFANETYCPFWDESERVRVISGEEEAVYGWAGVNFLLGNLVEESEGAGEALGGTTPTFGALDMGGASSQISFYRPDGDVMSGLFKLQVGQGKHWNVYARSHLMFGMNAAETRRRARLVRDAGPRERLVEGVRDPCLPGGRSMEFRTRVHFGGDGIETWDATVDDFATSYSGNGDGGVDDGGYHARLINEEAAGDWGGCRELARQILNEGSNSWCDFSHQGSCSFAGAYQPELPAQKAPFGEFYAFSNYYHVWQFLQLPPRSSMSALEKRGQEVCSQSWEELVEYNDANPNVTLDEDALETYCFHAAYVHEILRHGYGFGPDDHVIATNVLLGQKIGWTLGSILYEINTLPWDYVQVHSRHHEGEKMEEGVLEDWSRDFSGFMAGVALAALLGLVQIVRLYRQRSRGSRRKQGYEAVTDTDNIEIEKLARSCPDLQRSVNGRGN